jgi:hypothetical protein
VKNGWVQTHQYDDTGTDYSAWYKDYTQHEDLTYASRALAMTKIMSDPQWSAEHGSDPKWAAAAQFLQARAQFSSILQARGLMAGGSSNITANSNADLAAAWQGITASLAESNTDWGDMYHRYFERDALAPLPPKVGG